MFGLTSCWSSTERAQRHRDFHWWWSYDQCCHLRAPRNLKFESWHRKSDESRQSWCRLCRWCSRSSHLAQSFHVAACWSAFDFESCAIVNQRGRRVLRLKKKCQLKLQNNFQVYLQLEIPDWLIPPWFDGIAPAKPKAASPAKGFFASPVICEWLEKGGKNVVM
jgi:hypothetical protein